MSAMLAACFSAFSTLLALAVQAALAEMRSPVSYDFSRRAESRELSSSSTERVCSASCSAASRSAAESDPLEEMSSSARSARSRTLLRTSLNCWTSVFLAFLAGDECEAGDVGALSARSVSLRARLARADS